MSPAGDASSMDQKLIAWARSVKARARRTPCAALPPLWVFTDADRLPDPAALLRRLPRGLCGVVLRPGACRTEAALHAVLAICRDRRFVVTSVDEPSVRGFVQRHLRAKGGAHGLGTLSAAAHTPSELRRAARAGARCVFLSPAFATRSHPGMRALGACRWGLLAARSPVPVFALGGVTGETVRMLPRRWLHGAGIIGAAVDVAKPPHCSANAMDAA